MMDVKLWSHEDYIKWTDGLDLERRLELYSLGLCEEAGEVAGKIKRVFRDDAGKLTSERRTQVLTELGDVFYYFSRIVKACSSDIDEVCQLTVDKLESRRQRGTLQGFGDSR